MSGGGEYSAHVGEKTCRWIRRAISVLADRRFDAYRDEIRLRNYRKLRTFAQVGLILGAVITLVELLTGSCDQLQLAPIAVFLYFGLLWLIRRFLLPENTRHITLIFYLMEMPTMAVAIAMGTFLDPGSSSITIMVFLCAMPLFLLDKPWRVSLYICATAAVYSVCCFLSKDAALFHSDMVNLISFTLIALGINLFSLRERIESVESLVKYREKAERDVLTGIYNRGVGDEKIKLLLQEKVPGAFIIIDIDNFKQINDTFGHEAGDEALIRLTEVVSRDFRLTDVVMRLGGDEFTVYAVGLTDPVQSRKKLEELRSDIAAVSIPDAGDLVLTVSMGCALNPGTDTDYQELYQQADACLYRAKKSGKSRYEIERAHTDRPPAEQ